MDNPTPNNDRLIESTRISAALIPNSQTTVSGLIGALTYLWVKYQHLHGVDYDAGDEVAIGIVVMAVVSYGHDFVVVLLNKFRKWGAS